MKPCEDFCQSLAEVALGSPAEPGLAEHLEKCSACSASLAKMQLLTRKIDVEIRQLASVEPDSGGAARILADVRSQVRETRWLPRGRTIAAAFAGVVFLAVSLGIFFRLRTQREETERALTAAAGISSWQSPTRELLHSPYRSLLQSRPRLGETFYQLDTSSFGMDSLTRGAKERQKP